MVSTSTISRSRPLAFATALMAVLRGFAWRGNLRQLRGIHMLSRRSIMIVSYLVSVKLAESHLCVDSLDQDG